MRSNHSSIASNKVRWIGNLWLRCLVPLAIVTAFTGHVLSQAPAGDQYQLTYSEGSDQTSGSSDGNYDYYKYTKPGGMTGAIELENKRVEYSAWELVSEDNKTVTWRKPKPSSGTSSSSAPSKAMLLTSVKAVLNQNPDGTFRVSAAVQEQQWQIDPQMNADSKSQCEQDRADVVAKLKGWAVVLTPDQMQQLRSAGTISIPVKEPFAGLRKLSRPEVILRIDCNTPGDRTVDRNTATSPCQAGATRATAVSTHRGP
jgi:hypothetical protein